MLIQSCVFWICERFAEVIVFFYVNHDLIFTCDHRLWVKGQKVISGGSGNVISLQGYWRNLFCYDNVKKQS